MTKELVNKCPYGMWRCNTWQRCAHPCNEIGTYEVKKNMIYMDGEFTLDDLQKIVKMCKKQYRKDKLKKLLGFFNGR